MLTEAFFSAVADAVFGYLLEEADLAERVRAVLGVDPERRAFQTALARAYATFARRYPDLTASLFDESFLETEAAPLLAELLTRRGQPDPADLARRWAAHLGHPDPESWPRLDETTRAAADFLTWLEAELARQAALRPLWDACALERIAEETETIRRTLDETFRQALTEVRQVHIAGNAQGNVIITGNGNIVNVNTVVPPNAGSSYAPRATHHARRPAHHAPNPFTDRFAIRDPARFIGRERFLQRLLRDLEFRSIAIVGERKMGKSSILWRLKWELERESAWKIFLWDLFDPAADAHALLNEATRQLGFSGKGWAAFKEAVRGRKVVLLLDELDIAPKRGFGVDLLRGFRALHNLGWPVRLVTASRLRPQTIFPDPQEGSSPTDFLHPRRLGFFTEAEARRLLAHPWAPQVPSFNDMTRTDSDETISDELIALAHGHPYRLQVAAYHRYESLLDPAYDWRTEYEEEVSILEGKR